jgi:hypothetical protein
LYQPLIDRIDNIIKLFKDFPTEFDHNEYRCYADCKQEIFKAQESGEIGAAYTNTAEYDKYIDYITEKLGI